MEQIGSSEWLLPPVRLWVEENSVHIWRAYLPKERPRLALFMNTLSSDEHARAERFLRSEDRISFALTRGILRCVLSRYIDTTPEKICFDYTSFGRPSLCANPGEPMLNFNVSINPDYAAALVTKPPVTCIRKYHWYPVEE